MIVVAESAKILEVTSKLVALVTINTKKITATLKQHFMLISLSLCRIQLPHSGTHKTPSQ